MPKKQKKSTKILSLPSDNGKLSTYIDNNRESLVVHILNAMEKMLTDNLTFYTLFSFDNSAFSVIITTESLDDNFEYCQKYIKVNERYEHFEKMLKIEKLLKDRKK